MPQAGWKRSKQVRSKMNKRGGGEVQDPLLDLTEGGIPCLTLLKLNIVLLILFLVYRLCNNRTLWTSQENCTYTHLFNIVYVVSGH